MQKVIAKVEFGLCFALVAFQLYTAYFGNLFGIAQKAVHIGLIMSIIALGNYLKSDGHKMAPIIKPLSIFICLFGLFFAAYLTSIARALSVDMTTFTPLMKVVGIIFILILVYYCWTNVGPLMSVVVAFFVFYAFFGKLFPSLLSHSGMKVNRFIHLICFTSEGIFGTPLTASATFIATFIILGALFSVTGVGPYMCELANSLLGGFRGGPAKVAVISSALFGSISGSAVANVVGTGMFMEGIEQNPVVYDLQFELLTASTKIDLDPWINNYILRRYGKFDETLKIAWNILLETCYRSDGYEENHVGSCIASRPQMIPVSAGPCCNDEPFYDTAKFEKAVALFLSVSDRFRDSDGYQYDLCDLTRQAMSNRFYNQQIRFAAAYKKKDISAVEETAKKQLSLLADLDSLLSHRKELCFSRWINDCHNLAADDQEKRYFDLNARTLLTSWGDIRSNTSALYDYAWREWSGLIKEYYYKRWKMFYNRVLFCLKTKMPFFMINGNGYAGRYWYKSYSFGKKLNKFELSWIKTYSEYPQPSNTDVIAPAKVCAEKWGFCHEK